MADVMQAATSMPVAIQMRTFCLDFSWSQTPKRNAIMMDSRRKQERKTQKGVIDQTEKEERIGGRR